MTARDLEDLKREMAAMRREAMRRRWAGLAFGAALVAGVPVMAHAIGEVPHPAFMVGQPVVASEMNENFAFLRDGISSGAGTYVGWTTTTSSGRVSNPATGHYGYAAASELCAVTFSGASHRTVHMCTSDEMVHSAMRFPTPFGAAGPADSVAPSLWVASGRASGDYYGAPAPTPLGLFTDCRGFTDDSGSPQGGATWTWQTVPGTGTVVTPASSDCNVVLHIACCE